MASLVLTSESNVLEVNFHSDKSYTDKGFSAEYSAFDPSDRELKVLFLCLHLHDTWPCAAPTLVAWHYTVRQKVSMLFKTAATDWQTEIELLSDGGLETTAVKLES